MLIVASTVIGRAGTGTVSVAYEHSGTHARDAVNKLGHRVGLVEAEIYAVEILEEIDHCCGSPCAPGKMTGITRTPPSTNARSNARI
jgi:hypothetical protein